ncbi:MAG TPA: POTRA domain-containing protein, partial [Acidobacteriota bacterium]|nr:POTRA domain-containing protein [Acidobacteriota bacterium]
MRKDFVRFPKHAPHPRRQQSAYLETAERVSMKPRFENAAIATSSALLAPLCATLLGGWTAAALAQPDAGTLLNQEQRSRQRLPDRLPEPEAEPVRPALKETPGGARVVVRSVRFTGAQGLAQDVELQAVVADAMGRELDFAGLEKLAQRVTGFLRARGWFLAEAYLPRQDVTDGNIEIAIRPGRLDGGSGKGEPYLVALGGKLTPRIAPERLKAIAAGLLQPGGAAREGDMERAVLLMNDLPGITARARLEPGVDAGSTRVVIDAEEGPLLTGSVSLDNYGNRDTGLYQVNLAAQLNDPT